MKSIEFCYWLQGLFELAEPTQLNAKQTHLLKEHLKLVFEHDKKPMLFCSFLNGYLTVCNPTEIPEKETGLIKKQLNSIFEHVVVEHNHNVSIHNKQDLESRVEVLC